MAEPTPAAEDRHRVRSQLRDAIRLLWRADAPMFRRLMLLELSMAVMVPLQLLVARWVIASTLGKTETGVATLVLQAVVVFGCLAFMAALMAAATATRFRFPSRVGSAATALLIEQATRLRLATVEAPAFQSRLRQAEQDAAWRPARMTADIVNIVAGGSTVVALLVALAWAQPLLAGLCLLCVVLQSWWGARSRSVVYRHMADRVPKEQRLQYAAGLLLSARSAKEVRGYGIDGFLSSRFNKLARECDADLADTARRWSAPYYVSGLCSAGLAAIGLVVLWSLERGAADTADFLFVGGALLLTASQATRLSFALGHFSENVVFVRNFWEILACDDVERSGGPQPDPRAPGSLVVEGVGFAYPGAERPALVGIDLIAERGEIVGIVGPNGAGKSTLVNLLAQLYEPTDGRILWDGRDVADLEPRAVRAGISVLHQDFMRYQMTAGENIGVGAGSEQIDPAQVRRAGRAAGVDEFILADPRGYDVVLGTSNDAELELSTGQWQRIALARALVRTTASLLVLDEPSASLDGRGERSLEQLLRSQAASRITVIVSHRLSTLAVADRIYVLADGRVEQVGTIEELADRSRTFQELFAEHDDLDELATVRGD